MMIGPDTLFVVNRSIPHTDYTPLFSGIAASILVAAMALYSTRTQRKIAEKTIAVQLTTARKAKIVDARREWMKELRAAVSDFIASAYAIYEVGGEEGLDEDGKTRRRAMGSELYRRVTIIQLLMDPNKPSHAAVGRATRAVGEWAYWREAVKEHDPEGEEGVKLAQTYDDFNHAIHELNVAVSALLEEAWDKVRKGE